MIDTLLHPHNQEPHRLFTSQAVLQGISDHACRTPLSSEDDLLVYERRTIEDMVHTVTKETRAIVPAEHPFSSRLIVHFTNHANSLAHNVDGATKASQRRTSPDQFCYYQEESETCPLLYAIEYKPAHKLPVSYLRCALRSIRDLHDVVHRVTIPTDTEGKLQHNAEQLTASALTQVFCYMIRNGVAYSYLTNGLASVFLHVFLHVSEKDPTTLYYYLAEPNRDVECTEAGIASSLSKTAVSMVLSFSLMSLKTKQRDQTWRNNTWRNNALQQLDEWKVDFNSVLAQMPEQELHSDPRSSKYLPSSSTPTSSGSSALAPSSSPSQPPSSPSRPPLSPRRSRRGCADPTDMTDRSDSSDSNDSASNGKQSPTRRKRNLSQLQSSPSTQHRPSKNRLDQSQSDHTQQLQYCTQACLLARLAQQRLFGQAMP